MKKFSVASLFSLGGAGFFYYVIDYSHLSKEVASGFVQLVLAIFPLIWLAFDNKPSIIRMLSFPKNLVKIEGFTLPYIEMIKYGAIVLTLISSLSILIGFAVATYLISDRETYDAINALAHNGIPLISLYFLGVWLGSRCDRRRLLSLTLIILISRMIIGVVEYVIIPPKYFEEDIGTTKSIYLLIKYILWSTIAYLPYGLIGLWRGHYLRTTKYFNYLLKKLPAETQRTVINLLYEEVQISLEKKSV